MPTGVNVDSAVQRENAVGAKYKKRGGKWVIDIHHRLGSVRSIDLVSRDPDVLREHDTREAAIAYEMKLFRDKWEKQRRGEGITEYMTIPRKKLKIPKDQRRLCDSLVGEIRDNARDAEEAVVREVDGLHERHNQTQELQREIQRTVKQLFQNVAKHHCNGRLRNDDGP